MNRQDHAIAFEPLNESHFPLILRWFNAAHVQTFYSLRYWTLEEVRKKLHDLGDKKGYIITVDRIPIGYIQSYPVKTHPWDNQTLPEAIIQESAGIDLFIGAEEFTGKGFGSSILNAFLENHIWPYYRYCLADPDIRNEASMRLFKKCGFTEQQQIQCKDALQRPVVLQLLIKERE